MKARREADPVGIALNPNQAINRKDITDIQWEKLQPLLPPQKPSKGRPNLDHRQINNQWNSLDFENWCTLEGFTTLLWDS